MSEIEEHDDFDVVAHLHFTLTEAEARLPEDEQMLIAAGEEDLLMDAAPGSLHTYAHAEVADNGDVRMSINACIAAAGEEIAEDALYQVINSIRGSSRWQVAGFVAEQTG